MCEILYFKKRTTKPFDWLTKWPHLHYIRLRVTNLLVTLFSARSRIFLPLNQVLLGSILLLTRHPSVYDNIEHTIYSDFWCAFKISTLSSLNDADYLFVCFYKMAIRRQLLVKGSATMNIPGQVALFPPPPGPGCRNNNMRWQSKKSIANWLIKMNIKKN